MICKNHKNAPSNCFLIDRGEDFLCFFVVSGVLAFIPSTHVFINVFFFHLEAVLGVVRTAFIFSRCFLDVIIYKTIIFFNVCIRAFHGHPFSDKKCLTVGGWSRF